MGDAGEKVRIEGDNDVRILQAVLRVVVVAERRLRGRIGRIAVDGVPLYPLSVGVTLLGCLPLRCQGGRGDRVAQDVKSGASAWLLVGEHGSERGKKSGKLANFSAIAHPLGAVGVI